MTKLYKNVFNFIFLGTLSIGCINPNNDQIEKSNGNSKMEDQLTKALSVQDHIEIFGGYDYDPKYLKNPLANKRTGIVTSFIRGQNEELAAVVKLDEKIIGDSVAGKILILELRYEKQNWTSGGPVHLELCDFEPENKPWKDRRKGEWIEAAASFKIIRD